MSSPRYASIHALFLVISLAFLSGARADEIVLKNGRKIIALNVVEEGDRVRYETSAGQLTLPKSIIDHIEKGEFAGDFNPAGSSATTMEMSAPAISSLASYEQIAHAVVRDGRLDRSYITQLENDARDGSGEANNRAAMAHHAAAQFELLHGDTQHALSDERTALHYQPDQVDFLLGVAFLHLRRSEFKESLEYLDRARSLAPENPDVSKLAGWCDFGLNKIDAAVTEWKHSVALWPDPEVQAALDKATRDKAEEANYKENESAHFNLRYNGSAEPALARDVLHTLEGHFSRIESELNFTPPDSIGVILYTQQAFADITHAPGWVSALNDGRIRVPVQGLTAVNSDLSRALKHELTHSFVLQKTRGHAPTWIQEGLAQWMEGKRSEQSAFALTKEYAEGRAVQLDTLEGSWIGFRGDAAANAYAWALANIEYIVQTGGMQDVERILDRIAEGSSTEEALRETLHSDYHELMDSTAVYLRKNYVR